VAQNDLPSLIARAEAGSQVSIPGGTYTSPITLDRPLVLRGENLEECVLEVTADEPALKLSATQPVTIDSMTVKWQLATSQGRQGAASAVFVKDGRLTMRNCRVIALGNNQRCPLAVACDGFSNVKIENCRFEGFEFAIGYGGGAEGSITDCVVLNPGHCGISVYSGSKIDVASNVITGSGYHGVRCTGGTLLLHDNLIIKNKNRGIYLGNKSAHGRINNNVILGNGTGISAFAQSDVTIENNVIMESSYAGLGTRDGCFIKVRNNLFQDNTRGIVLFEETGKTQVEVGQNSFWNNASPTDNLEMPETAILVNPRLSAPKDGDFAAQAEPLKANGQGLSDADVFGKLWEKWKRLEQERAAGS
jgi:nitrous oxidase accessory protein NosD